jgi:hypothetical protein
MIYFKIFFTLAVIAMMVGLVTSLLMNNDNKRIELWSKIACISWIVTVGMLVGGMLTAIWLVS